MPRKNFEVCVVGSLNMDTVQFCDNQQPQEPGHSQATGPSERFPGGIGANHAVAIHRMSHPDPTATSQDHDANLPFDVSVSIIGKIGGQDSHGKILKEKLEGHHIRTQAVTTAKDQKTGKANITLQEDGNATIINIPNANSKLLPADVDSFWPASGTDLVVVSLEIPPRTASRAVTLAKKNKVPVILNLTPAPKPDLLGLSELFEVDHLIMNHKDADRILALPSIDDNARRKKTILQTRYSDAANRFHEKGAYCVVITLGEMGALASYVIPEPEDGAGGQKLWFFGAQIPVDPNGGPRRVSRKVKDLTGASDAFVGAYAVGILRQLHEERVTSQSRDISTALDMGIKAGGYSVGVVGGMEGCPWRDQVVGVAFMAVKPFRRHRVP